MNAGKQRAEPGDPDEGDALGDEMYEPTGELQGDDKPMPDRGTSSGVSDTYGADLGQEATNRIGSITSATKSDSGDLHRGRAEKA